MSVWNMLSLMSASLSDRLSEIAFCLKNPPQLQSQQKKEISINIINKAIYHGSEFLIKQQRDDGSFRAFLLYPGASSSWITAHISFVLENVPEMTNVCKKAAEFLSDSISEEGGWGYNRRVGIDCDSTSQALIVLNRFRMPVRDFIISNLLFSQFSCGGFPTYSRVNRNNPPLNGWQAPHPEVSCLVTESLRRLGGFEREIDLAKKWIFSQMIGGVVPSYWWVGKSYSLWIQTRTGFFSKSSLYSSQLLLAKVKSIPNIPMLLVSSLNEPFRFENILYGVDCLISKQLSDGSWLCHPCLRVTQPDCFKPMFNAPGRVYADRRRIFSTAHSIAALAGARNVLLNYKKLFF